MQGAELKVLRNSAFAKQAKVIYSEVNFVEAYENQYTYEELKDWIEVNDFQIVVADFDESRIDEYLLEGRYYRNIMFVKNTIDQN